MPRERIRCLTNATLTRARWRVGCFVLLVSALAASCANATTADWRQRTIEDLSDAHEIIERQSPASVDPENHAMRSWHIEGYRQALARAELVTSAQGWRYVLTGYVHGYGDPHLSFETEHPLEQARHPGFIASLRDGQAVVTWVNEQNEGGPRVGDEVTACDDRPLSDFVAERVFPFQFFAALPADHRRAVTRLFLDRGNPFALPPTMCSFNGGSPQPLRWREVVDDGFWQTFADAALGPRTAAGLSFPASDVTWIGVPSFAPIGDDSRALEGVIDAFRDLGDEFRSGRAIVVDLRGNTGGSSMMGERLARAIWGDAVENAPIWPEAVDWRAPPENARYVGRFSLLLRLRFSSHPIGSAWANEIAPGLRRSVRDGAPFYRSGAADVRSSGGITRQRRRGVSSFNATVYLLTNGTCASACLDFADVALHMPGVMHIGEETSGDGLLMEVRNVELPSDRGEIRTPIKVIRGRGRGPMEYYTPDVRYDGIWRDEDVRSWTLSTIGTTPED